MATKLNFKSVLESLENSANRHFCAIGRTKRTSFDGTQADHDANNKEMHAEFIKAVKILSSPFAVRDWLSGGVQIFDSYDEAMGFYNERLKLCEDGESDLEIYLIIDSTSNKIF